MKRKITVAAGIDIGGTGTSFGLVDEKGKIIKKGDIPTKGYRTFEEFTDCLADNINMLLNTGNYSLVGTGIGAPNGNCLTGNIEYPANLDWKGILPLSELMQKKLKVPVKITNDANAAALGEKLFGKGKGIDNFVMITLGTGLGSGIIANGKLIYGHSGSAGELGHVTVKENGRQCGCGKKGCLETYVSATGVVNTAKEFLNSGIKKRFSEKINLEKISSKDIYNLAVKGDELALEIFDFTAEILGKALADFTAVLSPEYFFFSGGLANAGNLLLKPAEKYMNDNLLKVYKNTVKIEKSALKTGEAAISGAAALIFDRD